MPNLSSTKGKIRKMRPQKLNGKKEKSKMKGKRVT